MSNHTAGPWFADGHFVGTNEQDTQTVAYVDDHRNKKLRTDEEHRANARLIAAAPEMLEAMRDALGNLGDIVRHAEPESVREQAEATWHALKAVIKKAEGTPSK